MTLPKGVSPIASNRLSPLLVLASESPRRLALLAQMGLKPAAILPQALDETPLKDEVPRAYATRLAQAKADAAARGWQGGAAVILAADTVVALGRRILPKAESGDAVRACLSRLSGRRHRVLTAVAAVAPDGRLKTRLSQTTVTFKALEPSEIEAYVRCGEGLGKAGGYAVQGRAERFVRWLNGSYSNVVGLPLFETAGLLTSCGLPIP